MTFSYLFRLRTNDISRQDQDSQFSLLPATSVACGEKSSPPPLPRFQRTCARTLGIYRYHYTGIGSDASLTGTYSKQPADSGLTILQYA